MIRCMRFLIVKRLRKLSRRRRKTGKHLSYLIREGLHGRQSFQLYQADYRRMLKAEFAVRQRLGYDLKKQRYNKAWEGRFL